jgi:chromosomal replication initiation ATPase DnaA
MLTEERIDPDEDTLIRDFKFRFQKMTGKACVVIVENKIDQLLRKLTIDDILGVVNRFKLPNMSNIEGISRKRELVDLRKIYSLLAKRAGYSLSTIGQGIGERDHTTIIYNIRKAKDLIDTDSSFKDLYFQVQNDLLREYEDRLKDNPQVRSVS